MAQLRLGSQAPDFNADTTEGPIRFHEWAGNSWVMLFSHPGDFTPVCTTELAEISLRLPDFVKRNVKVIGISADSLQTHFEWIEDIIEIASKTAPACVEYPIIADTGRKVSLLYDMLDQQDVTNVDDEGLPYTIRTVFIIDPRKIIRSLLQYPASVGRDFDEILRLIDALQVADEHKVMTPARWKPGDDVIIPPGTSDKEARKTFPEFTTCPKLSYMRTTPVRDLQ